jgi:hypothetical protein
MLGHNKKAVDYLNESLHYQKKNNSKAFFKTPEAIKKEAYLLKKIAKTNDEIETAYKYLGYINDLKGKVDSARY